MQADRAVTNVRRERGRDAKAEKPPRKNQHPHARRAESSITMELAQMSPSTVSGMSRAVRPTSPCACTRAYAC
jgi:hypothetical protein